MTFIRDADMEKRCRARVARLKLPKRFSMQGVADAVAVAQGVPVHLKALPHEASPYISGAVTLTPSGYVISYPLGVDEFFTRMCASHEFGHILAGHVPARPRLSDGRLITARSAGSRSPAQIALLKKLMPDLHEQIDAWSSGTLFRCLLAETTDPTADSRLDSPSMIEQEAELTGMLLIQQYERCGRIRKPDPARTATDPVRGRFADLLGPRNHDRRR